MLTMKYYTSAEAARLLNMRTRDVIRLMYMRDIKYTMIDGIAHIPEDAIEEYKAKQ